MSEDRRAFTIVVTQPGTPLQFVIEADGTATAGRETTNSVHLPHPRVSRVHARFVLTADSALAITDLESRNGTVVNGLRIPGSMTVPLPAVVEIGPFALAIAYRPGEETWVDSRPDQELRTRLVPGTRQLLVDGVVAVDNLTGHEFVLLGLLMESAPNVVDRDSLGEAIWGSGQWDVYMLHNLVSRIRKRISRSGSDEAVILTVPGVGYRLT